MVAGVVEDVLELIDVRLRAEVDADQSKDRLIDHSEVALDRCHRFGIATVDPKRDRNIEHLSCLGSIHREEEDVTPSAV